MFACVRRPHLAHPPIPCNAAERFANCFGTLIPRPNGCAPPPNWVEVDGRLFQCLGFMPHTRSKDCGQWVKVLQNTTLSGCVCKPMRSRCANSWRAWSSMLWPESSQAGPATGCAPTQTTSIALPRISKRTRAAPLSSEQCRCRREFFWSWIQQQPRLKGFGVALRSPLPRPQASACFWNWV